MGNGEWGTGNGKWGMGDGYQVTSENEPAEFQRRLMTEGAFGHRLPNHAPDRQPPSFDPRHACPAPITIPAHDTLKVGTLSAILSDIAGNLKISREDLTRRLFG